MIIKIDLCKEISKSFEIALHDFLCASYPKWKFKKVKKNSSRAQHTLNYMKLMLFSNSWDEYQLLSNDDNLYATKSYLNI